MRRLILVSALIAVMHWGCGSHESTAAGAGGQSVLPGDRCGDGVCDVEESCSSCPSDCAGCETGSGGNGTATTSSATSGATGGGAADVWFRSDFRRATYPAGGFDGNWNAQEGVYYDSEVIEGAGPDGLGILRSTYRAGVDFSNNPQHAVGVGNSGLHATITQGMAVFVRSRVRWTNAWASDGENYSGKHIMIGNAGANEHVSRVILQVRDNGQTPTSLAYQVTRNIDGEAHGTSLVEVTKDEFHSVQLYIKSSTTSLEIESITRSGSVATVTTSTPHGLSDGMLVEIRGEIDQWEYEGVYPITSTGETTFTYPVSGSPATPATGQNFFAMTADAELKMWIDEDNADGFDSPTDRSPPDSFGISVIAWGAEVRYGGFNNQSGSIFYSPSIQLDLGTFELGGAFDPNWGLGP